MPSLTIDTNGPTDWYVVRETPVHVAVATSSVFDGAIVALEQEIEDDAEPVLDESNVAIVYTGAIDEALKLNVGDRIRLNASGGGGLLNVPVSLAGTGVDRG